AFAAAHFAQLLTVEVEEEGGAARALALVLLLAVNMDVHEAPRAAGFLARGAELHHELVVRELHALQLLEPSPKLLESPPSHRALLAYAVGAFDIDVELRRCLLPAA